MTQTVTEKWTGTKAEVESAWITERIDLSFVTVIDRESFSKPVREEWPLENIEGALDAYWQHGLDCMNHIGTRA
jgi:hypothetical protein